MAVEEKAKVEGVFAGCSEDEGLRQSAEEEAEEGPRQSIYPSREEGGAIVLPTQLCPNLSNGKATIYYIWRAPSKDLSQAKVTQN